MVEPITDEEIALLQHLIGEMEKGISLEVSKPDIFKGLLARLAGAESDAARYRWIVDGNGYFLEERGLCHVSNEKDEADRAIDEEIGKVKP